MCRMLVVDSEQQNMLPEKARMYIHLLELPVELQLASGYHGARRSLSSGKHIDIILTNCEDNCETSEHTDELCASQPWVKRMLISGQASTPPTDDSREMTLSQDMDLNTFYHAISVLAPETARKAPDLAKSRRWYGSNPALQGRILEVLSIIKEEYANDISLEYLAQRVYTSPCYLSTLFRKFLGVSPLAYLNDYRMHQAVQLLLDTQTSVTEICTLVGYRNLPYFCTCFKSRYALTPAQFRERYRSCALVGA